MKTITQLTALTLVFCLNTVSAEQPNFLFLLSDDQTWNGLSCQMHPDVAGSKNDVVQTPNIAGLARQGMRFSQAYSPASVCSPTRISLQTGKSPAQCRWTKAAPSMKAEDGFKLIPPISRKNIDSQETTIGEMLQSGGYATAHYGKWHIGGGGPVKHGYHESDGDTGNKDAEPHVEPNPVDIFGMGSRAIAFMDKSKKAGKPFFIQMSYHALHYPQNATKSLIEKYRKLNPNGNDKEIGRAAIAEDLDRGVGELMDKIKALGIENNTYVIYMSDNGSSTRKVLQGGKGGVWEGGIRVPLIIRGPGIAADSWSHQRIVGYDLYPTLCELAGVKQELPKTIEGGSITHLFRGEDKPVKRPREELVFHFPHYQGDAPHTAIFLDQYKLIRFYEDNSLRLFDLENDLTESNNLAAEMPDQTKRMVSMMGAYLQDMKADMPETNPQYDPANPPSMEKAKGGGQEKKGGKAGSLLFSTLDVNGDKEISADELACAGKMLTALDRNRDGRLDKSEFSLSEPAGKGGGTQPPGGGGKSVNGSAQKRTPWILVHALELDANKDGVVEFEKEMMEEAERVFAAYDKNDDGKITPDESSAKGGMPRSALGGFVKEHASELDRDNDGGISKVEMTSQFAKFFTQADSNGDRKLTKDEYEVEGGVTPRFPDKNKPGVESRGEVVSSGSWIETNAEELDINGDGLIGQDELMNQARIAFGAFDTDGNGVLKLKEYQGRSPGMAVARFLASNAEKIDADHNGMITAAEFAADLKKVFGGADKNRDGSITREESETKPLTKNDPQAMNRSNTVSPSFPAGITSSKPARKGAPNVVLFLVDDLGWNGMGFSGNSWIETPRTDAMAEQGMVFSNAYASAPNCAPTRACLMSGQYTPRHGVYTVVDDRHRPGLPHHKVLASESNAELATESVTIAEAMKAGGYATGMFGMWNLGRGKDGPTTPLGQGFEVFKQPRDVGFDKDRYFNEKGEYLTDALTNEGIRWMEANRKKPFFMYMAYHGVHSPFEAKPELLKKYQNKPGGSGAREEAEYAATVEAVDQNVGRIVDAVDQLGLSNNTIVIFHSDNGGTRQYIRPMNGGKGTVYEGGLRVPTAIWGPGIKKGVSNEPMLSMDLYPTMLEFAGIQQPRQHHLDGESLVPLLTGESSSLNRDRVFWHFPSYIGGGGPCSAMRKGDWKVLEFFDTQTVEVYNLAKDPNETHNLAKSEPSKAAELIADLRKWHDEVNAPRPIKDNPNYDPDAKPERGRDKRGKGGSSRK